MSLQSSSNTEETNVSPLRAFYPLKERAEQEEENNDTNQRTRF